MSGHEFKNRSENNILKLGINRVISARGKTIRVHCIDGAVLVTWPLRQEQVLCTGQTILISPEGKVCILALTETSLQIQQSPWSLLRILSRIDKVWKARWRQAKGY